MFIAQFYGIDLTLGALDRGAYGDAGLDWYRCGARRGLDHADLVLDQVGLPSRVLR